MTLRTVTPANGASQLTVNYDNGDTILTAGQVLDVPVGSALETAIGTGNLTALTGTALANVQTGLDPAATENS
jgi:hypothetical protein